MSQSMAEDAGPGDRAAYAERLKIAFAVVAVVLFFVWIPVAAVGKHLADSIAPAQWSFAGAVVLWPIVSYLIARRPRG